MPTGNRISPTGKRPPGSFRLRQLISDPETRFFALALLVGLLGGASAIAFRAATKWVTVTLTGTEDIVRAGHTLPVYLRVLLPAAGGLVGGIIARVFVRSGATGPMGIAQIMEVVAIGRRTVQVKQSVARSISSLSVISSGGSEGREGPIIQLGAALAAWLGRVLKVSPERARVLVACGMAAGVAGAYNTPISGTLFVMEMVIGSFSMAIFGPAVLSAFASSILTRMVLGSQPLYKIPAFQFHSLFDVLPFAILGLLTGFSSVLFMRTLRLAKRLFRATGLRDEWRMALAGLGVGVIGIWFPEVWGNGFEGTNRLLNMATPVLGFFLALFALKILATALTIGSGGVGGVFTPGLMMGASLGGSVGILLSMLSPDIPTAIPGFTVLGMGGVLAGMTRAPFLAIIMIAELTQNEDLILPMMIISVLSIAGARLFERESVYVEELREAGVKWEENLEETALSNMKVKDIMRTGVQLISNTLPLAEVMSAFMRSHDFYLFVGDREGRLVGVIDMNDLKEIMSDPTLGDAEFRKVVIADDIMRPIPVVTPDEPLTSVNDKLWLRDLGWLPVVDTEQNRKFMGIITRRDLLGAIDREVLRNSRLFARVNRGGGISGEEELNYFELPERHRLRHIDVPKQFWGKTLAESQLRSRYGVTVISIRRLGKAGTVVRIVPSAKDVLQKGDRLVVLATDDALAGMEREEAISRE